MKKRTGFVSNSSSSSFIIGAGRIKDKEKFDEFIKKNKIDIKNKDYSTTIYIVKSDDELFEQEYSSFIKKGKSIIVIGEVNSKPEVSTPITDNKEDLYFLFNVGNDEGDENFYSGYRWDTDCDYSRVDYDYFGTKQQKLIDLIKNTNIIDKADFRFGAGRNG